VEPVRAVDEQQLDRLVEAVRRRLRQRLDWPHELRDARALDIRLEVAEAMVGVRVDRVDRNGRSLLRPEAEADGRLSLPRPDLDDHAVTTAATGELVERLALLVRQPPRNVGDQRLDARAELSRRTRHDGATIRRSRCVPAALGRATDTCPRARR